MLTPSRRSRALYARHVSIAMLVSATLALGACSSDDDGDDLASITDDEVIDTADADTDDGDGGGETGEGIEDVLAADGDTAAFVATAAPDFTSGRVDRLAIDGESFIVNGSFPATISDLRVGTIDGDMVEVARFGTSTLARYDADDTSAPIWEFSVNGEDADANPQDVIFDDAGFGYVTRFGGDELFVIDPDVTQDQEDLFVSTSFDLGAYDEDAPNMTDAVIVDGLLFVLIERLTDGFNPSQPGYVAVFDLATGLEVPTGQGADGLDGIELETINPTALQYDEDSGLIYLAGRGNFFLSPSVPGDPFTGGVESIDPVTFENTLLIDDGTEEDNIGFFTDLHVVSATQAYISVPGEVFPNASLLIANPAEGTIEETPVAGLESAPIFVIAEDATGRIWVGLGGDEPGFRFLDPATNTLSDEIIRTELNPIDIAFTSN